MGLLTERVTFRRANIYANPANPSQSLQRVYGDLTSGDLGVVNCFEIQKWNGSTQVFQIADHPIDATTPTVYVNNVATATGWTFSASNNFESHGNVATLTFTADQTGKQVSVKCKGAKNAVGTLIQNLAEIVYDVLVTYHGLGSEWDSQFYLAAYNTCTTLGYTGGGVLREDALPASIAKQVLSAIGGAFISGDNHLKLYIESLPASLIPEVVIPEDVIRSFTYETVGEEIANDIKLDYALNWRKAFYNETDLYDGYYTNGDAQSQSDFKVRTRAMSAPWLRAEAQAITAVATVLSLWKRPRAKITIDSREFDAARLEQADGVAFSHKSFPGTSNSGQPGDRRIMRVRASEVDWTRGVQVTGIDLGMNWWILAYLADGLYLADGSIRAGGNP